MLNSFTELEAYPMAHINDLLAQVGAANFISTLDMLRGYYQIPMKEASKKYMSFVTHRVQYQSYAFQAGGKHGHVSKGYE